MNSLAFLYPPTIRFGDGVCRELPELLRRFFGGELPDVLLVVSRSARRNEQIGTMVGELGDSLVAVYDQVSHDPTLATVDQIVGVARERQVGAVVAIGGGSVIDAAKAAAVIAPNASATCREFFSGERSIDAPGLTFVAVPTTAGTGAEITKNSVLTDEEGNVKKSLRSPYMVPSAALVDPQLTWSMPPALSAHVGFDALTQAVESFISLKANFISKPLAMSSVKMLLANLPLVVQDGMNACARRHVAQGSLLSALAFSQSGLGAVHGLAHPIGHALNLPHGETCATLLPHVLRWNAGGCSGLLTELASFCGYNSADCLVERFEVLAAELNIPETFGERLHPHVEYVVANCRSGSMAANPRAMSDEDVRNICHSLM